MTQKLSYPALRSALLRRVFGRPSHYATLCERSWAISPVESRTERPAIFLEEDLQRIGAAQEETTMEIEMTRIRGGTREHAETRAYLIKDVHLLCGRLYKGAMSHRISQLEEHAPAAEDVAMPAAALSSTFMGSKYFGHWLRDDASLTLAAEGLGPTIEVARQPYSHEAGYREMLGLPDNLVSRGRFGELILLDDWSQNAYKRRRYQELRARFRRAMPAEGAQRIYLKRGQAVGKRGRDLVNADAIEASLVAQGFTVVNPDKMSAREIAQAISGAKLIVGLEGSHMAHSIYPIADDGALVVLQPPMRFNNIYKDLSDALGLHYGFVVGLPAEGGFSIEPERLQRVLDRVPQR